MSAAKRARQKENRRHAGRHSGVYHVPGVPCLHCRPGSEPPPEVLPDLPRPVTMTDVIEAPRTRFIAESKNLKTKNPAGLLDAIAALSLPKGRRVVRDG